MRDVQQAKQEEKMITIEVRNFSKAYEHIRAVCHISRMMGCKIRLIYHAGTSGDELLKIAALENRLSSSEQPYEFDIIFSEPVKKKDKFHSK